MHVFTYWLDLIQGQDRNSFALCQKTLQLNAHLSVAL